MQQPLAYLHNIRTAPAPFTVKQRDGIAWLKRAVQRGDLGAEEKRALQLYERLERSEMIASRHTVLADYGKDDWRAMELYKPWTRARGGETEWFAPPLDERMKVFGEAAQELARELFQAEEPAPEQIVEVSCTGYVAPYSAQRLVLERGWEKRTKLLKIGHMGCYAALPALYLAARMVHGEETQASVLNIELCTLHLDPIATEAEQIVTNILFADGASRMDVRSERQAGDFALLAHSEEILRDTADSMSWGLRDSRFHMTLSRKVVTELGHVIKVAAEEFLLRRGLGLSDVKAFAIHPGGPRIIETVQTELGASEASVAASKAVLRDHGNMSSATLPHIWQKLMADDAIRSGDIILSMAFGPGLTLIMNLMRRV